MLEDQVAFLLQKYLGNYVKGLSREALKISVWRGDVELTNMQLKPEALNALKLPVKVKAGFLGSVKLKVPWSRLGQEPVLVYLDRIFLLVEPATQVEGYSEDSVQEAKKARIREMEIKMLDSRQQQKSDMNTSWLGSLINTIIGNLKLSVTNIHIRYEDIESNPGHPFAAGLTLSRLSAVTVDDSGKETFATGGALDHVQKSVELERLAFYLDSDISPWNVDKPWDELLPSEWSKVFEVVSGDDKHADGLIKVHSYALQPVTGNAKYSKLRQDESQNTGQPLQKAAVNLDDVTLCLSKDGYRDIMKLADNFAAFNQRLKYAHYRPLVSVKSDPRRWWQYAYKAVSDQIKRASGRLSWEQVLNYARLRKRYISLYISLLKSDVSRTVVDDNEEIDELDRRLDMEVILQWRMLAHQFLEQSIESEMLRKKQTTKKSWWSLGWSQTPDEDGPEHQSLSEEDWERLNKIIGYKEDSDQQVPANQDRGMLQTLLEIHMTRNASKLTAEGQESVAELSCEEMDCTVRLYSETKVFDLKLGSYKLSSPNGVLAESATGDNSLIGLFSYKPLDVEVDWSLVVKASPCYMTYLSDSISQIASFFKSSTAISQTIALETAAAVQSKFDEVKRSAQQQVSRALRDQARFLLDLDIAAPKITIPTGFCPDYSNATKLLLDLGNLMLRTQDDDDLSLPEEKDLYLKFNVCLSDISAFLVDGDYQWNQPQHHDMSSSNKSTILPVIDKCGIVLNFQQIRLEQPSHPSTRVALRLPSLGFHFSPARYHRLMQVAKLFQDEDSESSDALMPWSEADFEGWLSLLVWKGVGNREAVWQRRYLCLAAQFLYILESPGAKAYKQYLSLRGKQVYLVPPESVGNVEHVLAIGDVGLANTKVVEHASAIILRCDSEESRKAWHSRLQGTIYRASDSAAITTLSGMSSNLGENTDDAIHDYIEDASMWEKVFVTGVLDELRICFRCQSNGFRNYREILLIEERPLLEFRAIGGQVELSTRANDMFIGTVLKTLEVEDLFSREEIMHPRYLARSFIGSTNNGDTSTLPALFSAGSKRYSGSELNQIEGEEKFYEASDSLADLVESTVPVRGQSSLSFNREAIRPPSFDRCSGLLPDTEILTRSDKSGVVDLLDSFVKAQIIIHDQDSPLYSKVDKEVIVTLATLSFFCYRPTILAILNFVNAINAEEYSCDAPQDKSVVPHGEQQQTMSDLVDDSKFSIEQDPVVRGLLGKGKSRVIFSLALNMSRAQILLMNEDGSQLATLSQTNLLADIKVFPSSFGIKASLGNLKVSDDSLPDIHPYFWVCDMRNPKGRSFVELDFTSYSIDDEDYNGYDYSLSGQLSEVRIVYLNRFVQEVISYFMGLASGNSKSRVKLKDHVNNSEKWFTTAEIDGSPALKLDLSLKKPIIVMPRRTDSLDYLELDVVHITVQNTFQWLSGKKDVIGAVHLEILTLLVEDINLNVGAGLGSGESIIKDVRGLSVVIRRSLRDLLHKIPATEVTILVQELKAALSNSEYQIITECALSNLSETPHSVPPLDKGVETTLDNADSLGSLDTEPESEDLKAWITTKVSVSIHLVELSLYSGSTRDSPLAIVQVSGAWLLYKCNLLEEGFLFATLKGFRVIDDREGTVPQYRLAIGKPDDLDFNFVSYLTDDMDQLMVSSDESTESGDRMVPSLTMLILDAKLSQSSTQVSLTIQRPQLLVALDFLLAIVEFFVPSVRSALSNEENNTLLHITSAVILDEEIYSQPSNEFTLSPKRPLVVDDERFDHFVYDGKGGVLYLKDSDGVELFRPSPEPIIFVGNGKSLQFKNVTVKNGEYLDSCILLGANSSYSASEDDHVLLKSQSSDILQNCPKERTEILSSQNAENTRPMEFIIELQAIGPELTFYNVSKDVADPVLSSKLLHAQLDVFCRLVLKANTVEMSANVMGLMMESEGVRIIEPFDTCVNYSSIFGKTNIHLVVSDIYMNYSFSILRFFLAVEEDILAFLRMTSKKVTFVCSDFVKVGVVQDLKSNRVCAFWRPRAPPGFAVLGDCLTPLNEPPAKGVIAVNTSFIRVKRPVAFKLIWSTSVSDDTQKSRAWMASQLDGNEKPNNFSIWYPIAPPGYVAVGCVASAGKTHPPLASALCVLASLVSPSPLRDCIALCSTANGSSLVAFWRVDNSLGSFLPADPVDMGLHDKPYELRHMIFASEDPLKPLRSSNLEAVTLDNEQFQPEESVTGACSRQYEAVSSFKLVWWDQGTGSRKKVSIWRPVVPSGKVFLGDIAVQGYEPPNTSSVLHDSEDATLLKPPEDFQPVGKVKKQRGIDSTSFWLPVAPPGFVSLGCIACKGMPKLSDFNALRCIRSDMVTGVHFSEESLWDTSNSKYSGDPFSMWTVDSDMGTFIVRSGFRKPPKRFALKLRDPSASSNLDAIVINAVVGTFSAALFDDYGGLMVPLFNVSLSGIGLRLHGGPDSLSSNINFALAARSYNDKYDSWEPLVESMDGFVSYLQNSKEPGGGSQLRVTSTKDLNVNISVSNANMIFQAYASWNNLSHAHNTFRKSEVAAPAFDGKSVIDYQHRKNYYIIPQNRLGQDIYIRATELRGLTNIVRMPSGDAKPVKVPVSKNMLDAHIKGKTRRSARGMVTVIISDGQLPIVEDLTTHEYTVAIRLYLNEDTHNELCLQKQIARTCGVKSESSSSRGFELVHWNEVFFFKVDALDNYFVELMVTDIGKGELVGFYSAPLKDIALDTYPSSFSNHDLKWMELSPKKDTVQAEDKSNRTCVRVRCAILFPPRFEVDNSSNSLKSDRKPGYIQISPAREGPWTTVRLNYAARAACWRLGNDVVASEVSVKDGNRFVNIRSLVSVSNQIGYAIDLRLDARDSSEKLNLVDGRSVEKEETEIDAKNIERNGLETDEYFETQKFDRSVGWVSSLDKDQREGGLFNQESSALEDWEVISDWHVDTRSVTTSDGWVYAPDTEHLKWPETYDHINFVNYARQRRWIRKRIHVSTEPKKQIFVGQLQPGEIIPLPLPGLTCTQFSYALQLRPSDDEDSYEYSWSSIVNGFGQLDVDKASELSEIFVSDLTESEKLLFCPRMCGDSSESVSGLWFCLRMQATEMGKDIHSDPIHDWSLTIDCPLSIVNFLPLPTEYSVLEKKPDGHFIACSRGIFHPGETAKIYNADLRNPLYLSLLPKGGWLPIHEAVLISHPNRTPSKTLSLRSSFSGRIVQVMLEQNQGKAQLVSKVIRVYAPYWIVSARCPPLNYRFMNLPGAKKRRQISLPFHTNQASEKIIAHIMDEEMVEGNTIFSALIFKLSGLSASISGEREEHFGPVRDLSPLSDMDGSVDLYAYDADGNYIRLFVSSKPCPYQSVPTKVISVRPYMTFTNRLGQDIQIKLNNGDPPKILRASDSRVSLVSREVGEPEKLQVKLQDTEWSHPLQIEREDTLIMVLRKHDGSRRFLRIEIRGYEEGSRFLIVFRLGSIDGPFRIENRTKATAIKFRQSGLSDDAWIHLIPLSTTNFSWEDPCGEKLIDVSIHRGTNIIVQKFSLEKTEEFSSNEGEHGIRLHVVELGEITVARFIDAHGSAELGSKRENVESSGNSGTSAVQSKIQKNIAPLELMVELGVVGMSLVDHRPRELLYLYLERVFISYSTGYDNGATSRFKLILGHLQLDNQLPLTLMPVSLVPEYMRDTHHPVFKLAITMSNENHDGTLVYPCIYIRAIEKTWRVSIHEPIIWALIDFYSNLQLDRLPTTSDVTQVDPEIRIDLIDVSEIRLKLALETDPSQRPHGVLGLWSPILSAIGNALKIQVHLRKVMHRNRFMRKSAVLPAITNRILRDLIHNPLHFIFAVDVIGMTSSTLASLSKGFAELSTDGQFLQLRSKQGWSRRITGVGDGILQGTEALAQGVAFGVSGVIRKPVESAREYGLLGLAHGLGRAFVGFIAQPVSGALDFFSLTVDGIGASCSRCLEVFSHKSTYERIRLPRAIHANGVVTEYNERKALGQMVLQLAEATRRFGCTEIFKEPSKYAWSDYYEDHFILPSQRILLLTNKRVLMLQCLAPDKMDKKPCKILWDVPWEELMALELAKAGYERPSHLILHLKSFKRSENFVRLIKCGVEENEEEDPLVVRICLLVRKLWKAHQLNMKTLTLKVPSSQRYVCFSWDDVVGKDSPTQKKPRIKQRDFQSARSASGPRRFLDHSVNFLKIWSSERDSKTRCTICPKQVLDDGMLCSIWRPICPDGYVSVGDIAHVGMHPPNVAAIYQNVNGWFAPPMGYDLVWRNCIEDYLVPVSIWLPRSPEGYVTLGCVAVAGFAEPQLDSAYCVRASIAEEAVFEERMSPRKKQSRICRQKPLFDSFRCRSSILRVKLRLSATISDIKTKGQGCFFLFSSPSRPTVSDKMEGLIKGLMDVALGGNRDDGDDRRIGSPRSEQQLPRSTWAQVVSGEDHEGESKPTYNPPTRNRKEEGEGSGEAWSNVGRRPPRRNFQTGEDTGRNDNWETVGRKPSRGNPYKVNMGQWGRYKLPPNEQEYSEEVKYSSTVEPSEEELEDLSKACDKLWELDSNRLVPGKDYEIDCGEGKKSYQKEDMAYGCLFSWLSEDIFRRPTFSRFCSLLDNYNPNEGCKEVVTAQEKQEQVAFIEEISRTAPIKYLYKYLVSKRITSDDYGEFKQMMRRLWFGLYDRGGASGCSSAFEHVFVGEIKQRGEDEVSGFHNWIQFYIEEAKGRVDYQGYIFPRRRGQVPDSETQLLTIQFEWNGVLKSVSSSLVGVSPEFEIALYTLCFLVGKEDNYVQLGPYPVNIKCYRIRGDNIGSVFPIAES
ncbi:hypothetical protein H6P81_005391 [Aristolochia fimbriata]|uniref:PH domain-containing protein n=1 Tax=Aristolochia fimbriata TaxID=158543 RepID=A0AAV7EXV0_ARIFI|nr:hypothetical protein H6P81_005391 [Aristolochia fimbriata]